MRAPALLFVFTGCALPLGPDVQVHNLRRMEPLPVYQTWYSAVERCLGVQRDDDTLRWWSAERIEYEGREVAGLADLPRDVVMSQRFVAVEWAVLHEMAHYITSTGDSLHDANGRTPCETGGA